MMKPCARCDILKKIGPMNRRVEIQDVIEVQDQFGQPVETWTTVRVWRASRKDMQAFTRERTMANQQLAVRISVFTGRWFPGLTAKMRLWHDNMAWDIQGLAEIGRRDFHEIQAKAVRV